MTVPRIQALPYFGGKSVMGTNCAGRIIARLLPARPVYVEPFGGMCGVLLQRKPAQVEIVNDREPLIYNWWVVLRDRPDALSHKLLHTPHSRRAYERSVEFVSRIRNGSLALDIPDVEAACHVATVLSQGMSHSLGRPGGWIRAFVRGPRGRVPVAPLTMRMSKVVLENTDAVALLRRTEPRRDTMIYVDPPYREGGVDMREYTCTPNYDRLSETIVAQQGFVAISGYGSEWDHLDFHRLEMPSVWIGAGISGGKTFARQEVLWTSEPVQRSLFHQ